MSSSGCGCRLGLQLGSVTSLSLEEEEHQCDWLADMQTQDKDKDDGCHHSGGRNHHLHDLLAGAMAEQVQRLIRNQLGECCDDSNADCDGGVAILGLRRALDPAVHAMLRLAEDEPYGVRGANIFVQLASDDDNNDKKKDAPSVNLGSIVVDETTVSTFNLVLRLREVRSLFSVVQLRNWLGRWTRGSKWWKVGPHRHVVISPHFQLKKEKLYRSPSGSTLVNFQF